MATPSGTTSFSPAFSDLLLDVYSRIQVRPPAISADHMFQARMSAALMMSEWAVRDGPCLWKMEELVIPLVQSVATYSLPASTVAVLDYFTRQFQMNAATSVAPAFTTVAGSETVTVYQPNHGLIPGAYLEVLIPVAVGGLILYGTYSAVTVIDANDYTITASSAALSSVTRGGSVPTFTCTTVSQTITVTLPYHGLVAGQNFQIEVATTVGGIPLAAVYPVETVLSSSQFTITASTPAASSQTVAENGGLAYIATQSQINQPTDRVTTPISRSDYAAYPNKLNQAFPSQVWFNRQVNPTVTLYPVPDGNGPYELHCWAMVQFDDIVVPGGVGVDIPWRFNEAFASGLAAKLAVKFPPPPPNSIATMIELAEKAWDLASLQDVENVPLSIAPMMSGYFR